MDGRLLVIGGTGLVGPHILQKLNRPLALSREKRAAPCANWIVGDVESPDFQWPDIDELICTLPLPKLLGALPSIPASARRIIAFTSTSIDTKLDSSHTAERDQVRLLEASERQFIGFCSRRDIAWTILRPTLIYDEGRDISITPLSRIIKRFGFMPIVGGGKGRRQPVHASDLAEGVIAALRSTTSFNKTYAVPGGEVLTYREMIGRIFDAVGRRRVYVPVAKPVWKSLVPIARTQIPYLTVEMGLRMSQDMAFDASPAQRDFGWDARPFLPTF